MSRKVIRSIIYLYAAKDIGGATKIYIVNSHSPLHYRIELTMPLHQKPRPRLIIQLRIAMQFHIRELIDCKRLVGWDCMEYYSCPVAPTQWMKLRLKISLIAQLSHQSLANCQLLGRTEIARRIMWWGWWSIHGPRNELSKTSGSMRQHIIYETEWHGGLLRWSTCNLSAALAVKMYPLEEVREMAFIPEPRGAPGPRRRRVMKRSEKGGREAEKIRTANLWEGRFLFE